MKKITASILAGIGMCLAAQADIYWDNGSADGAWLNSVNWDTAADGTGGNPTITTNMPDIATFNVSALNSDQLVTLGTNISIGGLVFNNTGKTTVSNAAGTPATGRTLTLGAAGITINSNAGAVVIGQINPGPTRCAITLAADQTWLNNSTNLFTKHTGISLGTNTLTVDGTGNMEIIPNIYYINGTGGIIKNGTGTLSIGVVTSGTNNTYTGVTTINAGVLSAANLANGGVPSAIGASSSDAGNLVFGGGTLAHSLKLSGSTDRLFTIGNASGDTATLNSSAAATNAIWDLRFTNTGSIAFGTTNEHTLILAGTSTGTNIFACALGDSTGATSLVKTNAGTWFLSGTNSYSGGTLIAGGMLVLSGGSPLGAPSGALQLNGTGAKLDLGGTTQTVGAVNISANGIGSGVSNGTLIGTSYKVYVGNIDAVLAGSGVLTKGGGNPIYLNAANTYTNTTGIAVGKLVVNGSVQSSLITVNSASNGLNATLAGTGTVQAVTVNAGGFLTAGDSGVTGTLNFNGDALLSAGSTNVMEIYTAGFDVLKGNGANTLTMNGETHFDFTGNTTVSNGSTFQVLQNWGSVSTAGATFTAVGLDTNLAIDVSALASGGYLAVSLAAPSEQYTTNGTPYSWLDQYGLTNYVADDVLDQDNDGLLTWQEYIAGTVPTNSASGFKVAQNPRNTVNWDAVSGRVYSVYWSTNLVQGFTNLADNIQYPQGSYTNATPDAKVNHYQVKVQVQP